MYNLPYAKIAKQYTKKPIITVGGFRSGNEIKFALEQKYADFVSLSRPFICESDFVSMLKSNSNYLSKCINCNMCTVMTASPHPTRCYSRKAVVRMMDN